MEPFLGPDILLDHATGDLDFVDGDLVLSSDVRQATTIRLLTFLGEWFLDTTRGLPYLTDIFGKPLRPELVRSLYRNEIVNTPGVDEVLVITLDFDTTTRKLDVSWTATDDDSEIVEGSATVAV